MNLTELYAGNFLQEAFEKLQSMRMQEGKQLITTVEAPEFLDDDLLTNWIALNYLLTVDADGPLIMGEIGGVMPAYKGGLVLAMADGSAKVPYRLPCCS